MATAGTDVYVKLPSGKTLTLYMVPADSVQKVYSAVSNDLGIPEDRVNIKYTGKVLNRSHTVQYLGIRTETILKAEVIVVKKLTVYLKLPDGRTLTTTVENVSPVRQLYDFIATQTELAAPVLKLGNAALTAKAQSVMAAGITQEAIVKVEEGKITKTKTRGKTGSKRGGSLDGSESEPEEDNPVVAESTEDTEAVIGSFDAAGKAVEVVFGFDTTGSMYSCLDEVRRKLHETVERLLEDIAGIRIGIMAMGDYCDYANYVVQSVDLCSDVHTLTNFVAQVAKTSGGDSPEAYEWMLRKAQQLDWSENSAKALVVIGDCQPHDVTYTDQNINWHDELDVLKGMGVKVYGVQAYNSSCTKPFYQELADRTGGAYIQFRNFQLITDMFLAVCYREAAPEQLEAYCQEVEDEGRLTDEVKDMLDQVKETPKEPEPESRRYIAQAWWDPQLASGTPKYSYVAESDSWRPYGSLGALASAVTRCHSMIHRRPEAPSRGGTRRRSMFSFRKKKSTEGRTDGSADSSPRKSKKGCVVM